MQLLTRMYHRFGPRYPLVCAAVWWAHGLLLAAPVAVFVGSRVEGLSVDQGLRALLIVQACVATGYVGSWLYVRPQLRVVSRWIGGQRTEAMAQEVARATQMLPRRTVIVGMVLTVILVGPAAALAILTPVGRLTLVDSAAIASGGCFGALYGYLVAWLWLELATKPILAEVAEVSPASNRLLTTSPPLAATLFLIMLSATTLSAVVAGIVFASPGMRGGRLLALYGIAIAVSVTVIIFLVALVAWVVLQPLRELNQAARSVGGGDLDVQVPVTHPREFGDLITGFNEMVEGLLERDVLRGENLELADSLQASRARIVATADAERRRLERDLHDGAQQHLVLLGLKLGMARRLVERDPAAAAAMHDELRADLERALAELRDLAHGIYPPLLENEGLPGALAEAVQRAGIGATFESDGARRYPPELEAAVYFCCLEALQNAAKHAGDGARATVRLTERDGALWFEVADDGRGYDPAGANRSTGVQNMTDRIGALGGSLRIESAPGRGTIVTGKVPLASEEGSSPRPRGPLLEPAPGAS